jgi:hypothetical protein
MTTHIERITVVKHAGLLHVSIMQLLLVAFLWTVALCLFGASSEVAGSAKGKSSSPAVLVALLALVTIALFFILLGVKLL